MALAVNSRALTAGVFGTWTQATAKGGVDGFDRPVIVLGKLDETLFDITSLLPRLAPSLANPTSTLTRPASVTALTPLTVNGSSPYFTFASQPFQNGQTVVMYGTTAPTNFTLGTSYFVRDSVGNNFNLAATLNGAAIVAGTTGTTVGVVQCFQTGELIASSFTAPVVPSFSIGGVGARIPRVRLLTNGTAQGPFANFTPVPSWANVQVVVNLWSAAPTYAALTGGTAGDGNPYTVATGAAGWLGSFQVGLIQVNDGAYGGVGPNNATELNIVQAGSVFWDLQVQNPAVPLSGVAQTFTLIPELQN